MKFVKRVLASKKNLFFILIAFGSLITLYFWILAAQICLINYSLNEQRPAKIDRWEVQEAPADKYVLTAYFSFEAEGRLYSGKTRFDHPAYLNPDSAISALKEKAAHKESPKVWYDRGNPERASLQKKSCLGLFFRALLSSAVLIHFVLLRRKYSTAMPP